MFGFGDKKDEGKHVLPKAFRGGNDKEAETVNMVLTGIGAVVAVGGAILSFVSGARMADKVLYDMDKKNANK